MTFSSSLPFCLWPGPSNSAGCLVTKTGITCAHKQGIRGMRPSGLSRSRSPIPLPWLFLGDGNEERQPRASPKSVAHTLHVRLSLTPTHTTTHRKAFSTYARPWLSSSPSTCHKASPVPPSAPFRRPCKHSSPTHTTHTHRLTHTAPTSFFISWDACRTRVPRPWTSWPGNSRSRSGWRSGE